MKPRSITIVQCLLVAAGLLALGLSWLLLARPGQPPVSPWQWAVFGGAALALVLGAFVASLVRRSRRQPDQLPPAALSPVDVRRLIAVALVGCVLAYVGAYTGWFWLMTLGFMLGPLMLGPLAFLGARPADGETEKPLR